MYIASKDSTHGIAASPRFKDQADLVPISNFQILKEGKSV